MGGSTPHTINMARLIFVANPAASQFTGEDHREILRLLTRHHRVEAVWPASAEDARAIAADAVTGGFDGVVAMGGDGIVHQVAQSLVDTDVYLGVLPAGTTNVFARQVGLPARPRRAARIFTEEVPVRAWPVVRMSATFTDGSEDVRHAVFAAGVGVDADVVVEAETEPFRKYRFGAIHYARTALGLLWRDLRKRRPNLTIHADGRVTDGIGTMIQFHSAFTYFGRWPLRFVAEPPEAMAVFTIQRLPARRVASLLRRAVAGSLPEMPGTEVWPRVETVDLEADPPAQVELDGELVGSITRARFEYRPAALWVVGPPTGSD